MTPLRILLVDEHTILREGLRRILAEVPEFAVVGEAHDSSAALDQVNRLAPDVVVLDIALPGINGLELTTRLRQLQPEAQVVARGVARRCAATAASSPRAARRRSPYASRA